ncbi:MAG: type III polyketide synthase [Rhodothermia bacterium]|nr:MAG: type III polyketide synthase [Rhodothermia bacterium]
MSPVYIHHIDTAVPDISYPQEKIGQVMLAQIDPESKGARLLRRVYKHSGIEKRHSVIRDYADNDHDGLFFDATSDSYRSPSTGVRNDLYAIEARKLFLEVSRRAIEGCPEIDKNDITHVITVSCTGFFAPGPDYHIVKDLGLDPSTQRFHIGFMGCYAAFPALKMAEAFCTADPEAVVLIACLELCTLHLHPSEEIDGIVATSVFGDGASSAIVSARTPAFANTSLKITKLLSTLAPDSEEDMAWSIGDHGFDMVLSMHVPHILEANVESIVTTLLKEVGLKRKDIDHWAIHPGGRAILDKTEQALGLNGDSLSASRFVLRDYGNMSSATILFVLKEILTLKAARPDEKIFAMAFGPGLTVESALFTRV